MIECSHLWEREKEATLIREKSGISSPIFAVVIAKPSDEPVSTEELNRNSAVMFLFSGLFIY
jgi:hypothetical protein